MSILKKYNLLNVSTCVFISNAVQIQMSVHINKNTIDLSDNSIRRVLPITRCKRSVNLLSAEERSEEAQK